MNQSFTLLIVDDDSDDREMFIEVATEINPDVKCIAVANGKEALQLLDKESLTPDFIFRISICLE